MGDESLVGIPDRLSATRTVTRCLRHFRPDALGLRTVLGPPESAILTTLWAIGDYATVGDVVERMRSGGSKVHYSSAKTTLNALAARGCVRNCGIGRATAFRTQVSREEFEARIVRAVAGGLIRNYRRSLLVYLVKRFAGDAGSVS